MTGVLDRSKQRYTDQNNYGICLMKSDSKILKVEDNFLFSAFCNHCGHRMFDMTIIPDKAIDIRNKCKRCNRLVTTPLVLCDATGQMIIASVM